MTIYKVTTEQLEGDLSSIDGLFSDQDTARSVVLDCAEKYMNELQTDDLDPDELDWMEFRGDLINEPDEFYLADRVRCWIEPMEPA